MIAQQKQESQTSTHINPHPHHLINPLHLLKIIHILHQNHYLLTIIQFIHNIQIYRHLYQNLYNVH